MPLSRICKQKCASLSISIFSIIIALAVFQWNNVVESPMQAILLHEVANYLKYSVSVGKLRHSILANLDEFLSALKHVVYFFFFPHNLSLNIIMRNTICIIVNHSTANSTLLIYSSLSLYIYDQSWLVENHSIEPTKKYVQVCIFFLAISKRRPSVSLD